MKFFLLFKFYVLPTETVNKMSIILLKLHRSTKFGKHFEFSLFLMIFVVIQAAACGFTCGTYPDKTTYMLIARLVGTNLQTHAFITLVLLYK